MKRIAFLLSGITVSVGLVLAQGPTGDNAYPSSTSGSSGGGSSAASTTSSSTNSISEPSGAESQSAGTSTLQGTVQSEYQKLQIEQQLQQAAGVKHVINQLKVSANSEGSSSGTSSDEKQ